MRKNKLRLRICGKMLAVVILMSFLRFQALGEPLTGQQQNLNGSGMRLYSDLEVELLIDEVSQAALEAIEKASGEAAKAAVLDVLEREASALREAQRWRIQADISALAVREAKKAGIKNTVITGIICFFSGFATGIIIMGVVK